MVGLLLRQSYLQTKELAGAQLPSESRSLDLDGDYVQASLSILSLVLAIYLAGFMIALPVFTVIYLRMHKESWMLSLGLALLLSAGTYLLFVRLLSIPLYPGVVSSGSVF